MAKQKDKIIKLTKTIGRSEFRYLLPLSEILQKILPELRKLWLEFYADDNVKEEFYEPDGFLKWLEKNYEKR